MRIILTVVICRESEFKSKVGSYQTKRILLWKYRDVLHICGHICKDVSLGVQLQPLCCDLKKKVQLQ